MADATGEKRPGRLRRRLLWFAALAITAVVLAAGGLVAGVLAISSGWQRARVVAALEDGLSEALGTRIEIGALDGPLLPGFEARDVRVGPTGNEIGTIGRLGVRLDLDAWLLGDQIVIDTVEIEGLALLLRRDASGWNLPTPPEAADEAQALPYDILVRRIRVRDSRIDVAWTGSDGTDVRAGALVASFAGEVRDIAIPRADTPPSWGAASGSLALESGELAGTRVERGALDAEIDAEHQLQLAAVTAGGFGEIGIQGRGDLDAWLAGRTDRSTRIDVAFDALDLSVLPAWLPSSPPASPPSTSPPPASPTQMQTRLTGSAALGVGPRDGASGAPEIVFSATLQPSRLGSVRLTRASLEGTVLDDAWQIDELSVEGQGLSLDGKVAGVGSAPRQLDLKARIARLDDVSSWLPRSDAASEAKLEGSLSIDARLTTPDGRLEATRGQLHADGRGIVWQGDPIGDVELRASLQDGRRVVIDALSLRGDALSLDVEPGAVLRLAGDDLADGVVVEGLRARSEAATLAADGRIDAGAVHDLRLQLAGLHPARLGTLEGIAIPSGGRIDAELTLNGPFDAPRAEGWLTLADGAATLPALRETFAPIDARVRLENEVLHVETLTVGPPGARAEMTGRIALPGLLGDLRRGDFRPGRADLRLRIQDFALTRVPLPQDLASNGEAGDGDSAEPVTLETGGRIDADLRLTGPLLAPTVTGDLEWRQPRWEDVQLDRLSLHVEADEALAQGTLKMRYAGREILVANARLPVPTDAREPLDWLREERARIEIRGESLDFALLAPFLTRLVRDPRGTADLKLVVRGGRPDPRIDGLLTVANGSIRVPLLRQTFSPVAGVARFDGRQVTLESLSVGTPEAGLEADGILELVDLRPERVDLSLRLANFPASRSQLVVANVDGHVALKGPVAAPALTGELSLRDTRVTVRSGTDPVAREVRVRATDRDELLRERERSGPGLLDRASIDLALTVPGDTWIRSPELELDVAGWARIEKRTLEPMRISGDLTTRRGTVRVVGKRFRLRRGEAILDGASDPDPVLDIEAIHPVADIVVVAYVTGRASEPILRLESEPELPEDEVVSYLFFGRPSSQLGASEQGSVSLAAAGLAAGMALDELRDVFGHDLPIDTIDVRIQEGDEPSRVEVGKYVAKDVFVRYGHTFGSEPVDEVGVSYRINENWRLESTTSSDAAAGADLYWTIDY